MTFCWCSPGPSNHRTRLLAETDVNMHDDDRRTRPRTDAGSCPCSDDSPSHIDSVILPFSLFTCIYHFLTLADYLTSHASFFFLSFSFSVFCYLLRVRCSTVSASSYLFFRLLPLLRPLPNFRSYCFSLLTPMVFMMSWRLMRSNNKFPVHVHMFG